VRQRRLRCVPAAESGGSGGSFWHFRRCLRATSQVVSRATGALHGIVFLVVVSGGFWHSRGVIE